MWIYQTHSEQEFVRNTFLIIITFEETEKSCQFFDGTFSNEMYFLAERLKLL